MQKLPIVDTTTGAVLSIFDFPGDEAPEVLVIDKMFYRRGMDGFYRSITAYVVSKNLFFKDGNATSLIS